MHRAKKNKHPKGSEVHELPHPRPLTTMGARRFYGCVTYRLGRCNAFANPGAARSNPGAAPAVAGRGTLAT